MLLLACIVDVMSTPVIDKLLKSRIAVSYAEFGSLIGITAGGVRQQVARGALPFVPVGGRRLIPISEVQRIKMISDQAAADRAAAEALTA